MNKFHSVFPRLLLFPIRKFIITRIDPFAIFLEEFGIKVFLMNCARLVFKNHVFQARGAFY